jgi:hypothetical protein
MKNIIKRSLMMLFLIMWNSSCASSLTRSIPKLENRTLRLSKDGAMAVYEYEQCTKKWALAIPKCKWYKDIYDLKDDVVRNKLIDVGFVLEVRQKP